MWPSNNTAFLIIHGVGPHQPFEVCDAFVRGFKAVYDKQYSDIKMKHKLRPRSNWLGQGIDWVQSYISLSLDEKDTTIDFYEYYWDIFMVHRISLGEAVKLVVEASEGARQWYKNHPQLKEDVPLQAYSRKRKFGLNKEPEFAPAGYLKMFGFLGIVLSKLWLFRPFAKILLSLAGTQLPILSQIFNALGRFVEDVALQLMADGIRYFNLDPRSQHFETRQKILNGAMEELKGLMEDYGQIIVAGHSMGSVIAYDALNRLIQKTNADSMNFPVEKVSKVRGIVTFGSPLDKLAILFRAKKSDDKQIQRQIVANLHKFRAKIFESFDEKYRIEDPMKYTLPETVWLNFYHRKDLISDKLDLYDFENYRPNHLEEGNIRIEGRVHGLGEAHSCYWGVKGLAEKGGSQKKGEINPFQMYEHIIKEFFP